MRAVVAPCPGSTAVERGTVPIPQIGDDELLVKVQAIGVGIHDSYFLPTDAGYPYPIGIEAAGIVAEVGTGVATYSVGDRIAFVSAMQAKGGTWAEYAAVTAGSLIVSIPESMGFVEAAAVPVAGNTILRALHAVTTDVAPGSLFVAGGSGAIGTLAVQLASRNGWRVAASASEPNHAFMLRLGAELAVDYRDPAWPDQVRQWVPGGVDAAIAIPPGTAADSQRVVRDGGSLVAISGDTVAPERGVRAQTVPHTSDVHDALTRLMADVAAGEVHVEIEQVYPFDEALDALAKVQTRHARGKVVIRLDQHADSHAPE